MMQSKISAEMSGSDHTHNISLLFCRSSMMQQQQRQWAIWPCSSLVITHSPRVTIITARLSLTTPTHSSEYSGLKSSCSTSCEKSFCFSIYPWSTLCPQLNKSQAMLLRVPLLIKFSLWNPLQDLRREGCIRLRNVWTAPYECSQQIYVKSKGSATVPSVF